MAKTESPPQQPSPPPPAKREEENVVQLLEKLQLVDQDGKTNDGPPTLTPTPTSTTAHWQDIRLLFWKEHSRGRVLQRGLEGLTALHARLTTEKATAEAGFQAAQHKAATTEETLRRLKSLQEELERRFNDLMDKRQAEAEAEAAKRASVTAELQATVEDIQAEQLRVQEEFAALRAKREAYLTQLREEMAVADKEGAAQEKESKVAEAEVAGQRAQLEELEGAFAAMETERTEQEAALKGYLEEIAEGQQQMEACDAKMLALTAAMEAQAPQQGEQEQADEAKQEGGAGSTGEAKPLEEAREWKKKVQELERERKLLDAKKEKHEKAFGDVHGKDAKVKAELDEVETKAKRLEELVAKLQEEDALLMAKILSASQ